MKNFTKILGNILFISLIVIFAWIAFSTLEIIAGNLDTVTEYSQYNFYEYIPKLAESIKK
jgi:hypothetical protein